jgi:NTE family protein
LESDERQHGRLGLALSGGGHRAAFFHIGVLARLAELGRLRGIEVISTVSGGSMLGAAYYLYVKKLLESTPNNKINDAHYVDLVKELEDHYREAMAKNLRGLALANYVKNYKLVMPNYSRTNRVAEVLEKEFYRPILGGSGPIDLYDLRIEPLDDNGNKLEHFDPTKQRLATAAVPVLLMNATTLNTGHNFRFEATWLGEPELESVEDADVDKNTRFVRWKRDDLPASQHKTLGLAVASSGCFPGGLAPVAIKNLYGRSATDPAKRWKFVLKLVDGGVRDNQGLDALLDMQCKRLIVSDGSAQLDEREKPGTRLPALLPRVASIQGKESREQRILRAYAACGEDCVAFMHLLTGRNPSQLVPLDGTGTGDLSPPPPPGPSTGLDPIAQRLIARVRTDLDAFSDFEASAVMETGYRAAKATVTPALAANVLAGAAAGSTEPWRFHAVGPQLETPVPKSAENHLRVAAQRFFKPLAFFLASVPVLRIVLALAALGSALAGLVIAGIALWGESVPADLLYLSGLGLLLMLVLYLGGQLPVIGLLGRFLFDMLLTLIGAVLPFWLFAGAQIVSGWLHRAQGPDAAA